MSYEIECEKRVMLSESQYLEIISYFENEYGPFTYRYLRNRYFDTPNHDIINARCMLRIRSELDKDRTLTLKIEDPDGDIEVSQKVNNFWLRNILEKGMFPDGDVKTALRIKGFKVETIKCFGHLDTRRLEIKFKDHLLVIDLNYYGYNYDYNLEIEAPTKEKAEKWILYYCKKFNIKYSEDYLSKSARFFKSLEN